ncbi:MAG: NAD(P)H-dependent glycerol-3-phosphate dehydrogenase [Clostridiales bacterium]|nr:NAD(P)H-dependent glycerol-3-phosphate dehydrogenase [Clostridiales bacterium]
MLRISIIGLGSWGIALAGLLCDNGHEVALWGRNPERVAETRERRRNAVYLPDYELNKRVLLTDRIQEAAERAEIIVISVASAGVREISRDLASLIDNNAVVVSAAKGIDPDTLQTMTAIIGEEIPGITTAALSGPSHAEEVAAGLPTTCVAASRDAETAELVQDTFMSECFRVYTSVDLLGVELGGALKNVIALAAGISDGMAFGDNAKAALMTRGIAEIARLGSAMGADTLTFSGLSGIGDLFVTCESMHSRNRRAGILLGKGKTLDEALAEVRMVVEGVSTAKAAHALAERYNVDMPITNEIYKTLFAGKNPSDAVADLMGRDKKTERNWGLNIL